MTDARGEILARLRMATADVTTRVGHRGEPPVIQATSTSAEATLELFAQNVAEYRAHVVRCSTQEVPGVVADALASTGSRSVAVPDGLEPGWLSGLGEGVAVVADDRLSAEDLDGVDAVLTAARLGIATTGTIVLDHTPDQGRRALSLVPDVHVCVVRADQVVHDVPEAVALLDPARPLTWISGPSATSDIELDRVEGVHGPRTLEVIIAQ